VESVCGAFVSFRRDLYRREATLTPAGAKSLSDLKQRLQRFFSGVSADANRFGSEIRAAGTPNVTNGKHDAALVVKAVTQLASRLNRMNTRVKALPTNNPAVFYADAQQLAAALHTLGPSVARGDIRLNDNPTLDRVAKSTPACATLSVS
jgi:hypothetical protein